MFLEWKKELLRKKNWILIGIAIFICVGIAVLANMQEMREYEIKRYNYTHNIELLQGFIKEKEDLLEKKGNNANVEHALEEDKVTLQSYEAMLEAFEKGDWKQELELNIEQLKKDIESYYSGSLFGTTEEALLSQLQQYEYLYENDIHPQNVNQEITGWNLLYMLFQGGILPTFLPLLFILISVDIISAEQDQKTMKLLLFQPISRNSIFRRKFLAGLFHTICLTLILIISIFITGCVIGGVGEIRYPLEMCSIFELNQEILTLKDYFLQSIPLWLCSIFFYTAFAFMISIICLNSAIAIIIGIIVVEGGFSITKMMETSLFIYQPFYAGNIGQLFTLENTPNGWIVAGVLLVSAILCIGIANFMLKKKQFYL